MNREYLIRHNNSYKFEVISKEDFMKCLNYYRDKIKKQYTVDVREDYVSCQIRQDWIFKNITLRVVCEDYDDLYEFITGRTNENDK